jgi:hypothetical protein
MPGGYITFPLSQTNIVDAVIFFIAIPMDDLFPWVISCEECRGNKAVYVEIPNTTFERERHPQISLIVRAQP